MSDAPDNSVFDRLREIRAMLGRVLVDTADLRLRVGALEATGASVSLRVDRIAVDVDRIMRRLDLIEEHAHEQLQA